MIFTVAIILPVTTGAKAGSGFINHIGPRLVVRAHVRSGLSGTNHNTPRLVVKTAVRAGGAWIPNHNTPRLVVKSGAKYPAWLDDILKSDRVRYID